MRNPNDFSTDTGTNVVEVVVPKPSGKTVIRTWEPMQTAHDKHRDGLCLICRHITVWHDERGWCGMCMEHCMESVHVLGTPT